MIYYKFVEEGHNAFYDNKKVYAFNAEGQIEGSFPDMLPADPSKSFYYLKDAKKLKIRKYIPEFLPAEITDFSILGLIDQTPYPDRGRKYLTEYLDPKDSSLVVSKTFTDYIENGEFRGIDGTFRWYREDGEIGLEVSKSVKRYSPARATEVLRIRRERVFDFLISQARGTSYESYIDTLMDYYEEQIEDYKVKDSTDFANALENETNETILAILAARVPFAADPSFTVPVKESIQYQIFALDDLGLLATLQPAS